MNRKAERGSSHILQGRWIDEKYLKSKSVLHASMSSNVYGIERHTFVSCDIKFGHGKASHMVTKMYQALSVFDNMSNKWFMTIELPKVWSKGMNVEGKNKYKVRICMVIDRVLD